MTADWLIGAGELFDTVAARLGPRGVLTVGSLDDASIAAGDRVVIARDGWEPERDLAEQSAVRARAALLPGRVIGDLGVVGPWVRPGAAGCQVCAERRRRLWRRQNFEKEPLSGPLPALPLTPAHLDILAAVTEAALFGDLLAPLEIHVTRGDLGAAVHRMVPLPNCPGCDGLPEDGAELAAIELRPRPQPDPDAFRTAPDGLPGATLRARVHDWRYGPVGHVFRSENAAGALVSAELALPGGAQGEGGHGRATHYPAGEVIALYEAMERLASATPHGKRTSTYAAAADLESAIDLREIGLPDPRCHDDPLFRFTPYSDAVPTDWVWGWRLGTAEPVLLPEHVAYWHVDRWRRGHRSARFVYESSNGCASGSNLEEAILYGLFEVIERDSFLLTWYTRRPARPLAVTDDEVPQLRGMRAVLDAVGYDLHLFDVTTELGLPSVLSLVLRRDDDGPVAFFAAGAHCDPRRAVASAAAEAVTNAVIRLRTPERTRLAYERDTRPLLDDPSRTSTLKEHTGLYNFPETRSWWSFLDPERTPVSMADAYGDWRSDWRRDDLTEVLRLLIGRIHRSGLDAIVVDQTDRCADGAPATVKVVVPQTVPMTFGHVNRRTRHLDRLHTLPVRLGYRAAHEAPVDPDSVPPHPFP